MQHRHHRMPFGAEAGPDGVRFALWAPTARDVRLVLGSREHAMEHSGDGWFHCVTTEAAKGSRYGFRIDGALTVPDPASRFQPDGVHGPSLVVDPAAFSWSDDGWTGRPWEDAVIYEIHMGTATREGTYASLMGRLQALQDLGVTAIELMPLSAFDGIRNWGYDGVLPFAPAACYGTPDDLKRLVNHAHGLGIMVLLDVVYNHFGPSGNYLHSYARTFFTDRHHTPWGSAINVDGARSEVVRDFFIHNAHYWLEEFHMDGLRFDAVHAIPDDSTPHFIEDLALRLRQALPGREVHLVLENEANEARWLVRDGGRPRLHTAQWADDIHNAWHVVLTGETEGYYEDYAARPLYRLGRALAEGFAYQGEGSAHQGGRSRGEPSGHLPPSAFVSFLQNHDQVGNRAFGERLCHLAAPERLRLAQAVHILAPQIPLLFMGEEWDASTPFQFFVDFDHDPPLANAVRQGRRQEFSRFKAFADPDLAARIPDPTDKDTFARSALDWDEPSRPGHAEAAARMRRLLETRRDHVIPLLKTAYLGSRFEQVDDTLVVAWSFAGGTLRCLMNLGGGEAALTHSDHFRVLWKSPDAAPGPERVVLPAWSGIISLERPA